MNKSCHQRQQGNGMGFRSMKTLTNKYCIALAEWTERNSAQNKFIACQVFALVCARYQMWADAWNGVRASRRHRLATQPVGHTRLLSPEGSLRRPGFFVSELGGGHCLPSWSSHLCVRSSSRLFFVNGTRKWRS